MAVARPELMPSEMRWVVQTLREAGVPHAQRRAMRELVRAQERADAMEARERAHSQRLRRSYATARACPDCQAAQRGPDGGVLHAPGCRAEEE